MKTETTLADRVEQVRNLKDIQCSKGNFDQGEYMRGMANGLILAIHTLDDAEEDCPSFDWPLQELKNALQTTINQQSAENGSNTPDYILAQPKATPVDMAAKIAAKIGDLIGCQEMPKYGPYNAGLMNGLLVAKSVADGSDPVMVDFEKATPVDSGSSAAPSDAAFECSFCHCQSWVRDEGRRRCSNCRQLEPESTPAEPDPEKAPPSADVGEDARAVAALRTAQLQVIDEKCADLKIKIEDYFPAWAMDVPEDEDYSVVRQGSGTIAKLLIRRERERAEAAERSEAVAIQETMLRNRDLEEARASLAAEERDHAACKAELVETRAALHHELGYVRAFADSLYPIDGTRLREFVDKRNKALAERRDGGES